MPKTAKPTFRCRYGPRVKKVINRHKIINNFYFGNNQFVNIRNANITEYNVYSFDSSSVITANPKTKQLVNAVQLKDSPICMRRNDKDFALQGSGDFQDALPGSSDFQDDSHDVQPLIHNENNEDNPTKQSSLVFKNDLELVTPKSEFYQEKPSLIKTNILELKFPIQQVIATNLVESTLNQTVLKDMTNLDRFCTPKGSQFIENLPADMQSYIGQIIRIKQTKYGKINKNQTNFRATTMQITPKPAKGDMKSTGTSTPEIIKNPKHKVWELSPITTTKENQNTNQEDKVNNAVKVLQYDEESEQNKSGSSEDIFDLINFFDACKVNGMQDNNINKENKQHESLNSDTEEQVESLYQESSYRTTRYESFVESSFVDQSKDDDSDESHINTTADEDRDELSGNNSNSEFASNLSNSTLNDYFNKDLEDTGLELTCAISTFGKGFEINRKSQYTDAIPEKEWRRPMFAAGKVQESGSEIDTSEFYTDVIPGKKWRRSLRVIGMKRATLTLTKQELSTTGTKWNFRLSINPQNIILDKTLQNLTKLREITEQTFPDDDVNQTVKTEYDSLINDSFFDDINKEFDCTGAIHQHVTYILQSEDILIPETYHQKGLAEEKVLNLCYQKSYIDFPEYVKNLTKLKKIGEGIYGEVFSFVMRKQHTVVKFIPIEGDRIVNYTAQKTFGEIFSEICVALSLSNLKNLIDSNYTDGFCSILKVSCLKGKYPDTLIEVWNKYEEQIGSENEPPTIFDSDQLYIALEMLPGGEPMESYKFCSARQAYAILLQVIHSLAAAEQALKFEHRDLHWGNILISQTCDKTIEYIIQGRKYTVVSFGKKATIIDYTLSRIRSGKFDIYNDLENDLEIFQAYGDSQFDIYRDMRKDVNGQWETYVPKTNVRWIHYLADKCFNGVYYKAKHKIHKSYLHKINVLKDNLLKYNSATDVLNDLN